MAFAEERSAAAYERKKRIPIIFKGGDPSYHYEDYPEEWDYEADPEETFDAERVFQTSGELVSITPSEFVELAIKMPDKEHNTYVPFSFAQRRYLRRIYDTPNKRVLLKCGRQVEKCVDVRAPILLPNNSVKPAGEVRVGDYVLSLDGSTFVIKQVTWVSARLRKPGLLVRTRQGHEALMAPSHPLRTWEDWKPAGELQIGDRIAVVRQAGYYPTAAPQMPHARVVLTAYMLGDGHMGEKYLNFTSLPGAKLDEFLTLLDQTGVKYIIYAKDGTQAVNVRMNGNSELRRWLAEDGLLGCRSQTKFIPGWVFDLHGPGRQLFLNRLWSTDGHVKKNSSSKYSIEYCSISRELVDGVQRLLWGQGVPTKRRTNYPKKGQEAYILRVETQDGVYRFLKHIGALGKSETVEVPGSTSNNNRDVFPLGINDLVRRIIDSRGEDGRLGRNAENSLRSAGLRETLKYPPTKNKLELYVSFFRSDERYDQDLVDELELHTTSQVYWDEIVALESTEEIECVDFEVEGTHNFVVGGMVSHNSTLLGNKLLAYCCINTSLNALYVSPTNMQSKVFSQDRLKEPIETSDFLKSWTTTKLSDNVFLKKFINRSQITLRYSYLNADRVRGIPADIICIDELQDILLDNLPVIEECASHSHLKLFMYSGTPKSLDNTLESWWVNQSTQNEWVVPCHRHSMKGPTGKMSSAHWNVLSEEHIGDDSLICDKCKEPILSMDPDSQWVAMNPGINKVLEDYYEGYRIPQLMVPWLKHSDILDKQHTYSRARFYNEVLGLAYDSGTRPLTRQDLIDNCNPNILLTQEFLQNFRSRLGDFPIYAGVDWGSGEQAFTVIALGAYMNQRFTIFYIHRFEGPETDPKVQMEAISRIIAHWRVNLVGVDYGGGFWPNDELIKRFGWQRIAKYQYSTPNAKVRWDDGLKRYMVNRTEVMSDIFNAIKRRNVFWFPNWEHFQNPFGLDCLNIFSEYSENRRMNEYKKAPKTTDDSFHAMLYCFLASMIREPRPDVISPMTSRVAVQPITY